MTNGEFLLMTLILGVCGFGAAVVLWHVAMAAPRILEWVRRHVWHV